jgi:murein DD-endopeptidase MepM/ murein hydrolase activator NlpD
MATMLCLLAFVGAPATAAPRYEGYVAPVQVEGMGFPIARSGWYSVINFTDDWHDPRMRFEPGVGWQLIGVHEGNDIFAEPGTPILAVLGGRVENLGWTFYSGWRVGVRGDDGRYWFYAHMRRFAPGLSIGDRVDTGTLLGEVGNTGYGAVPGHDGEFTYHLHIGIQEPDGTWVNPYPLMRRLYRAAVRP